MASDSERITRLEEIADQHTATLSRIDSNVISLLETRAFQRGALKMVFWVSATVSTIIGLLAAWVKH